MISSKRQMLNVMKQCEGADTLTREQKFQVFVNVCDNMLNEGRLSKANHKRWTEIWQHVTVDQVPTILPTGTKIVYIKRVKEINHSMTITERNQKLYDLRAKMHKLETELAWVKQEIWIVNDQYDRQNLNLFEEMFGTNVTYTDTPMAEEYYGG